MFLEVHTIQNNKVLLNIASIRYIIPNKTGSTIYTMSYSYGNYDQILNVKQSYDQLKQIVEKFCFPNND